MAGIGKRIFLAFFGAVFAVVMGLATVIFLPVLMGGESPWLDDGAESQAAEEPGQHAADAADASAASSNGNSGKSTMGNGNASAGASNANSSNSNSKSNSNAANANGNGNSNAAQDGSSTSNSSASGGGDDDFISNDAAAYEDHSAQGVQFVGTHDSVSTGNTAGTSSADTAADSNTAAADNTATADNTAAAENTAAGSNSPDAASTDPGAAGAPADNPSPDISGNSGALGVKAKDFVVALRTYDTQQLIQHKEWLSGFAAMVDPQLMKEHPKKNLIRKEASTKWAQMMASYDGVKNMVTTADYGSVKTAQLDGYDCLVVDVSCTEKCISGKLSHKTAAWKTPNVVATTYYVYFTSDGQYIFCVKRIDAQVVATGDSW